MLIPRSLETAGTRDYAVNWGFEFSGGRFGFHVDGYVRNDFDCVCSFDRREIALVGPVPDEVSALAVCVIQICITRHANLFDFSGLVD